MDSRRTSVATEAEKVDSRRSSVASSVADKTDSRRSSVADKKLVSSIVSILNIIFCSQWYFGDFGFFLFVNDWNEPPLDFRANKFHLNFFIDTLYMYITITICCYRKCFAARSGSLTESWKIPIIKTGRSKSSYVIDQGKIGCNHDVSSMCLVRSVSFTCNLSSTYLLISRTFHVYFCRFVPLVIVSSFSSLTSWRYHIFFLNVMIQFMSFSTVRLCISVVWYMFIYFIFILYYIFDKYCIFPVFVCVLVCKRNPNWICWMFLYLITQLCLFLSLYL